MKKKNMFWVWFSLVTIIIFAVEGTLTGVYAVNALNCQPDMLWKTFWFCFFFGGCCLGAITAGIVFFIIICKK